MSCSTEPKFAIRIDNSWGLRNIPINKEWPFFLFTKGLALAMTKIAFIGELDDVMDRGTINWRNL
jgi:hypothetical protein